jgi:hypothetical protein
MHAVFADDDRGFDEFTLRLKTKWEDADSVEAKDRISELFHKFAILWLYINKNFRHRWQR